MATGIIPSISLHSQSLCSDIVKNKHPTPTVKFLFTLSCISWISLRESKQWRHIHNFRPDSTSCASWCPLSPTCRANRLRGREEGQSGGWGPRERVEGQRGEGGLRGRVEGLRYVLPGRPTAEICFVLKFFLFILKRNLIRTFITFDLNVSYIF